MLCRLLSGNVFGIPLDVVMKEAEDKNMLWVLETVFGTMVGVAIFVCGYHALMNISP